MNSKKVLLSVVAIVLALSVVSMMGFAAADKTKMDINGDKAVSVLDATIVLRVVAGIEEATLDDATPAKATAATHADATEATDTEATPADATEATATEVYSAYDVNNDGRISVLDAITILRAVAESTATTPTVAK